MKKYLCLNLAFICLFFISCDKEEGDNSSFKIEGLTMENYPKMDGSTSTDPLNRLIASKLLGYNYKWEQAWSMNGRWFLSTKLPHEFVSERIKSSQTHNSIINLIDKKADLILSARKISEDEKAYADKTNVNLIETPIALDAFIFVVNLDNPVKSLTTKQVVDIYTGKIKNWKEVGGNNNAIKPYIRNQNSGSQELMKTLVMKGIPIADFDVDYAPELNGMFSVFSTIRSNVDALSYTVFYYKEQIVRGDLVKSVPINALIPNKNSIKSRKYPYVSEVYATIRTDLDRNSMAYQLYELIQTKSAKNVIVESGYIAE